MKIMNNAYRLLKYRISAKNEKTIKDSILDLSYMGDDLATRLTYIPHSAT